MAVDEKKPSEKRKKISFKCNRAEVLTEYAATSAGIDSGRCHLRMDRISRTTRPKATIRTPSKLAKTASGGRLLYAAELLAPPFLWKRLFHFIMG